MEPVFSSRVSIYWGIELIDLSEFQGLVWWGVSNSHIYTGSARLALEREEPKRFKIKNIAWNALFIEKNSLKGSQKYVLDFIICWILWPKTMFRFVVRLCLYCELRCTNSLQLQYTIYTPNTLFGGAGHTTEHTQHTTEHTMSRHWEHVYLASDLCNPTIRQSFYQSNSKQRRTGAWFIRQDRQFSQIKEGIVFAERY